LLAHFGRAQTFRFEQDGTATHTETVALAGTKTQQEGLLLGVCQCQYLDFHSLLFFGGSEYTTYLQYMN
jgi:hypothetical protein